MKQIFHLEIEREVSEFCEQRIVNILFKSRNL